MRTPGQPPCRFLTYDACSAQCGSIPANESAGIAELCYSQTQTAGKCHALSSYMYSDVCNTDSDCDAACSTCTACSAGDGQCPALDLSQPDEGCDSSGSVSSGGSSLSTGGTSDSGGFGSVGSCLNSGGGGGSGGGGMMSTSGGSGTGSGSTGMMSTGSGGSGAGMFATGSASTGGSNAGSIGTSDSGGGSFTGGGMSSLGSGGGGGSQCSSLEADACSANENCTGTGTCSDAPCWEASEEQVYAAIPTTLCRPIREPAH